jgi:hypothetical protein
MESGYVTSCLAGYAWHYGIKVSSASIRNAATGGYTVLQAVY